MKRKLQLISLLCVLFAIALDQFTKFLAVKYLKDAPISLIDGVFELHYLENRGAAFGILQNQQWFFLVISCILLVFIALIYRQLPFSRRMIPLHICLIAVTAGAIGNMIDRVRLDYVIDFLYFELIDFPIFNVADIYVSVATFALAFLILFYYKDDELDAIFKNCLRKKKKEQERTDEA
ncbi:MAG: signal peptidase II [Faecalimonas sp.]|nr:signal peptidase II [Faecalimonas sp.]